METYEIFPYPQKLTYIQNQLTLSELKVLLYDESLDIKQAVTLFERIRFHLKNFSQCLPKSKVKSNKAGSICISHNSELKPQHYSLCIRKKFVGIEYSDLPSLFYAIDTLQQIIGQANEGMIYCLKISDGPDFPNRGIMLDISRCKVPTMDTLRQIVDWMSSLRLNQLQLYTEHTFAYKKHKTVWKESSPITGEEIQELSIYSAKKGIELVPNMNSFGHFERWLRHKEYKEYAECPDGFTHPISKAQFDYGTTLYPDQKSLRFVSELLDEFLPHFSSSQINIGGDETWELGMGKSKELANKIGKSKVYLNFLKKIHSLVENHGKTMMFWGDIILKNPELITELPKDIIAMNWGYEESHPFKKECPHFKKAGVPFYVCPGTSSWQSISGRLSNSENNLASAAIEGKKNGAVGYLITDWGDGGHHQALSSSYISFVTGAAYSWCYDKNKLLNTKKMTARHILMNPKSKIPEILYKLGKLSDIGDWKPVNSSIFHSLIFLKDYNREQIENRFPGLNKKFVTRVANEVHDIESDWKQCKAVNNEEAITLHEIKHTINLVKFGLQKFCLLTNRENSAPYDYTPLKNELLEKHPNVWLLRNRIGGLKESQEILIGATDR